MWEYSLTVLPCNLNYLNILKEQLEPEVKAAEGIITILINANDAKLLLAVKTEYKRTLKRTIINYIAELIIMQYKLDYLVSNFNFKVSNDINMQAFLKALTVFDSDVDKQIILKQLAPYDHIVLESFFTFKLGILKAKWKDLINLANDNIMYLMSSDTFIELLKFLITNLDFKTSEVNVFYSDDNYFLKDSSGKLIENKNLSVNLEQGEGSASLNEAFLITSLIGLSPQKIKLHCDTNFKNQTINLLFSIFADRIIICN